METGRPCYKARLLHYFADPECASKGSEAQAPWCGWHTDHSSLTGTMPLLPFPFRPNFFVRWRILWRTALLSMQADYETHHCWRVARAQLSVALMSEPGKLHLQQLACMIVQGFLGSLNWRTVIIASS